MTIKNSFLAFLLIGGMLFAQTIFAEGAAVGISPLVFEITANPGETVENILEVSNPTDNVIKVKMTVEDIAPTGEEGNVKVESPGSGAYSIASWVKCDPQEFQIDPQGGRSVKFTISVPADAEAGGHYGTIVAEPAIVAGSSMTGATIVPRIGSVILVSLPGERLEKITAKDFYTQKTYQKNGKSLAEKTNFFQSTQVGFAVKLENQGTVHLKPAASVTITDWFGQKVVQVDFPAQNVLPGATRIATTEWKASGFAIGRYTATLTGGFGTYNTPLSSSNITFWVIPIKECLIVLAIIIFFILTRKRWLTALKIIITGKK